MDYGFVLLSRKLIDDHLWLSEKFTRGQAWVDLICLASYDDGIIKINGIKVPVKRGEVGWSRKRLAIRWGWSHGKVRRFLAELEADQRTTSKRFANGTQNGDQNGEGITDKNGTQNGKGKHRSISLITILNYDRYQDPRKPERKPEKNPNGTPNGEGDDIQTDSKRYPIKESNTLKEVEVGDELPDSEEIKAKAIKQKDHEENLELFTLFQDLATAHGFSKPIILGDKNEAHLRTRKKEAGGFEKMKEVLMTIPDSPYLMGNANHSFTLRFSFILKPEKFTKLLNRDYHDDKKAPAKKKPMSIAKPLPEEEYPEFTKYQP